MVPAHHSLIYIMVIMAASDGEMSNSELNTITEIIQYLPIFKHIDFEGIPNTCNNCLTLLNHENGLDEALHYIKNNLPSSLKETGYALACEVAAADGVASQQELRLLEMIRDEINIERLIAAGIERGVRARYTTL